MPVYEYQGLDRVGKKANGTLDADSVRDARAQLREKKIYISKLTEVSKAAGGFNSKDIARYFQTNRISQKDLAMTTRQLATLLSAGLPLVTALSGLSEQTENEAIRRIFVGVREDVEEGSSLSVAMEKYPKAFPRLFISMVSAGEASGTLDTVLTNLADHLEAQVELVGKIRSAMMYPVAMLVICLLVIVGLFVFLVPKIVDIFKNQGAALPFPTRITMAISDFLVEKWWLMIILSVIGVLAARYFYKRPNGRAAFDRGLLKLPVFSKIYQKIYTARIAQTLSALLDSGVQLLSALEITTKTVANVHVIEALRTAQENIRKGKNLSSELKRTKLFPAMLIQMLSVGEKSGALESMLSKASQVYQAEVNSTLGGLTKLLELVMIVIVGAIVLWVVLSVMLPMTNLMDLIQA